MYYSLSHFSSNSSSTCLSYIIIPIRERAMNSNEMALFIETEFTGRGHVGIADAGTDNAGVDEYDR